MKKGNKGGMNIKGVLSKGMKNNAWEVKERKEGERRMNRERGRSRSVMERRNKGRKKKMEKQMEEEAARKKEWKERVENG